MADASDEETVRAFISGRSLEQILDVQGHGAIGTVALLDDGPAELRTLFLRTYQARFNPRCMRDSEHGIDGCFIAGGAEVWNAQEFSPWIIRQCTFLLGHLEVDRAGALRIQDGGRLFVLGNLDVGDLHVIAGELHCLGTVTAQRQLVIGSAGYLAASALTCADYGGFGTIQCANRHSKRQLTTEPAALRS